MVAAAATVILPIPTVAIGASVFLLGQAIAPLTRSKRIQSGDSVQKEREEEREEEQLADSGQESNASTPSSITSTFRHYRILELQRIIASLKANAPILIAGEEGSGKSVLASAVVEQLSEEGFTVAFIEPATPKQMLVEIAEQLGVDTHNLEGKALTVEGLKTAIARYFQQNTAFLVIDDAHLSEPKFRSWLKGLKRQGVPMLLLATDPPRSDVFINLPRIELSPLPEYAIRELMEQAALERGLNLKSHELARLQERAGGNPNLAIRTVEEEYLGLDIEAGDHRRYIDGTPLLLLAGVGFVVIRFIGLGTNNQALYIFGGILAAIFLGVSRLLSTLR